MTLVRQTRDQLSVIRTRIRFEIRDPASNPNGVNKPSSALSFQNSDILNAINETIRYLGIEQMSIQSAENLLSTSFAYSSDPMDFPTAIGGSDRIIKVEDFTDTAHPVPVEYVSREEIESHTSIFGSIGAFKYTLEGIPLAGGETDNFPRLRIRIRPSPVTGRTFRVWYEAPPIIVAADGDRHELFGRWQDLVVLQSVKNLLRGDQELTPQQEEQRQEYLRLYRLHSDAQKGGRRVGRRRSGRS